jgi:hypothetical protein
MPGILKPEKSSNENILLFLETVEDEELRELIINNIENILAVGADEDADRSLRTSFFDAISRLIEKRTGGNNEN